MRKEKNWNRKVTRALSSGLINKKIVNSKRSQEEMLGFAMILIVVAVIILVFISFSLKKPVKEPVENYEVSSFLQSIFPYTTDCRDNLEYLPIRKLILRCRNSDLCEDGRNTCDVLKQELQGLVDKSWNINKKYAINGYLLNISIDDEEIMAVQSGNLTGNYKGAMQSFTNNIDIQFVSYYD